MTKGDALAVAMWLANGFCWMYAADLARVIYPGRQTLTGAAAQGTVALCRKVGKLAPRLRLRVWIEPR